MSLWSTTEKPKHLTDAEKASVVGVDAAEAAANNLTAGWVQIQEYTDAQGNARRKSVTLVAMGSIPTDGNTAITDDLGGGGGGLPSWTYGAQSYTKTWYDLVTTVSADGTKVFATTGGGNDATIYQGTLAGAFNLSQLTLGTSGAFPFNLMKTKTPNLAINADGTKLYTLINDGGTFAAYMEMTTPYDATTLTGTFVQANNTISSASNPRNLSYADSGTKAHLLCDGVVHQWILSSAYDLNSFTGEADSTLNLKTLLSISFDTILGFALSADGTTGYCTTRNMSMVPTLYQFTLATPFDITTAESPATLTVNLTDAQLDGIMNGGSIVLNSDNTRMLISGATNKLTSLQA